MESTITVEQRGAVVAAAFLGMALTVANISSGSATTVTYSVAAPTAQVWDEHREKGAATTHTAATTQPEVVDDVEAQETAEHFYALASSDVVQYNAIWDRVLSDARSESFGALRLLLDTLIPARLGPIGTLAVLSATARYDRELACSANDFKRRSWAHGASDPDLRHAMYPFLRTLV